MSWTDVTTSTRKFFNHIWYHRRMFGDLTPSLLILICYDVWINILICLAQNHLKMISIEYRPYPVTLPCSAHARYKTRCLPFPYYHSRTHCLRGKTYVINVNIRIRELSRVNHWHLHIRVYIKKLVIFDSFCCPFP